MMAERLASSSLGSQRTIATALLLIVSLGLWALIDGWVISGARGQAEWRQRAQSQLGREKALAAHADDVTQRLERLKALPEWNRLLPVEEAEPRQRRLQEEIRALIAQFGYSSTLNVLPSRELGSLTVQPIEIKTTLTMDQLASLLQGLSQHARYLRTERLHVLAPQSQSAQSNSLLEIELVVAAYALRAAA